jgi:hypothetical protein
MSSFYSQSVITGKVQDTTNTEIQFCSLALMNAADSSVFKGNITDEKGEFRFENIPNGNYFIKLSYIGYLDSLSEVFTINSISEFNIPTFHLINDSQSLEEVAVIAFRKTVSFENGKVILNVENDILSSGSFVIELLRRIPGVSVDAQNNVTVNGKSGVRFMIDGRLQQIPAEQMIAILGNMNSEAVSKIELIKNPPAKYDASGTGGLINIVTKKSKLKGFNGSVTNKFSQGKGASEMMNLNLNYKSNKLSLFFNTIDTYTDYKNSIINNRTFQKDQSVSILNMTGKEEIFVSTINLQTGVQYDYSAKTVLGLNVDANWVGFKTIGKSNTNIIGETPLDYSNLTVLETSDEQYTNPTINMNLTHLLDTNGSQLIFSTDFMKYNNNRNNYNNNYFLDENFSEKNPVQCYYNSLNFKNTTQKIDFVKVFSNSLKVETGVKSSFVVNSSNSSVAKNESNSMTFSSMPMFSNNLTYKEQIIAGYLDVMKTIKKITVEGGVRAEQTLFQIENSSNGFKLNSNYINFFPNLSVDFKQNENRIYHFSYSYRLDRPDYEQFNPSYIFNNRLNYSVGNPYIKPQYSHNFELELSHNEFISNSFSFVSMNDGIYTFSYMRDSSISIDTVYNFGLKQMTSYNLFIQKQLNSFYRVQLNSTFAWMNYSGVIDGNDIHSTIFAMRTSLNNDIMLPKNIKLQVLVSYSSPYKDGFQNYSPQPSVNIALQKRFLKNKLNVVIGFRDLFYSDYSSVSTNLPNQTYYSLTKKDSRRIRINLTYTFGKIKIENKIQDKKAEETIRIKTM